MIEYNIFTEKINFDVIVKLCNAYFTGYTVIDTIGYWKGKQEASIIIKIIDNLQAYNTVKKLALQIKKANNQEAVLLTYKQINSDIL